jgi:hypothetical protein
MFSWYELSGANSTFPEKTEKKRQLCCDILRLQGSRTMNEYVDRRTRLIDAPPDEVFRIVCALGGDNGWHSPQWVWNLRGFVDRRVGGDGLVPRRHPEVLELGDLVDFWQVTVVEPPSRLRLLGAMKMPGLGIMEFKIMAVDASSTSTRLSQTATFAPKGPLGHLYWIALLPIHYFIFKRLIGGIAHEAERTRDDTTS